MSKGEESRTRIVESAVAVFNTKGYTGTSLQDIMDKTGFTKGGIYRHFGSKEELAAEAFTMAYRQMKAAYMDSYSIDDAPDVKLTRFLQRIKSFMLRPPVKGGCPILNSATEVDDTNEPLRKLVKAAAADWEDSMKTLFHEGKTKGIFLPALDAEKEAKFFLASIEGSILLCKLHRNIDYGLYAADILMERIRHWKR